MSSFRNLPIARKLSLAFGLVCTLCIGLGLYTLLTFHGIASKNAEVSGHSSPSVVHLAEIPDRNL